MRTAKAAFERNLNEARGGDVDSLFRVLATYNQLFQYINGRLQGKSEAETLAASQSPEIMHSALLQQHYAVLLSQQGWVLKDHIEARPDLFRFFEGIYHNTFTYFKDMLATLSSQPGQQVSQARSRIGFILFQSAGVLLHTLEADDCLSTADTNLLTGSRQALLDCWRAQIARYLNASEKTQMRDLILNNNPHLREIPHIVTTLNQQ